MVSPHGKHLNAHYVHKCEVNGPVKVQAKPKKLHAMRWDGLSCSANGQGRGFWVLLSPPSASKFSEVFRLNPFLANRECLLWKLFIFQLGGGGEGTNKQKKTCHHKKKRKQNQTNKEKKKQTAKHPEAEQQKLCISGRQQAVVRQEISPTYPLQREELSAPSPLPSMPQDDSTHEFLD